MTERGSKFVDLTRNSQLFNSRHYIFAGKLRRYHGQSWFRRSLDVRTNLFNLRDAFLLLVGVWQAIWLLKRLRPDVIFIKGGFVGVPVGLAAALWRIPFVTHDSDALPGLANRLVGRWACLHATGMPPQFYTYPTAKIRYVGVLVGETYRPVTEQLQAQYRQQLNLPTTALVVTITGGSLGAQRLNRVVCQIAPALLEQFPQLYIIHQVGRGNQRVYGLYAHPRLQVFEFLNNMQCYTGAADVVITRAGTTAVAELGVQGKAIIVVPNPLLTEGHQLKNAHYWAEQQAAVVVGEADLQASQGQVLSQALAQLLSQPGLRRQLGQHLQAITIPDATDRLVKLLLDIAKAKGGSGAASV